MVVRTGTLPAGVFPIILFSLGEPGENEIAVGRREVPLVFQYRIVPMTFAFDTKYPPWKEGRDTLMSQTAKCADLIANTNIRIRRDGSSTVENVRLDPLPLEQPWKGRTLTAKQQGVARHSVSACCDQDACLDRCLQFPQGELWMLEILTPQWGVDEVRVVSGRVNQGGSSRETYEIKEDPGIWPVLRVPCLYCPIKSCVTNCSNGEYSTGFADIVVRPCELSCTKTCLTIFLLQNGLQTRRVECKPCPPGTWNTCKTLPNCRWRIPQSSTDTVLGQDIHALRGGPGDYASVLNARCGVPDTSLAVGTCYSCSTIRTCQACRVHYVGTDRETFIETSLAWKCPGMACSLLALADLTEHGPGR